MEAPRRRAVWSTAVWEAGVALDWASGTGWVDPHSLAADVAVVVAAGLRGGGDNWETELDVLMKERSAQEPDGLCGQCCYMCTARVIRWRWMACLTSCGGMSDECESRGMKLGCGIHQDKGENKDIPEVEAGEL